MEYWNSFRTLWNIPTFLPAPRGMEWNGPLRFTNVTLVRRVQKVKPRIRIKSHRKCKLRNACKSITLTNERKPLKI